MINGIINIYKEAGFTSHDVVAKLRGILRQKKIGHTGTLDPQATGVLPVCLGSGTKLCDMLTDKDKEYVAELLLGVVTDTQDVTGSVLCQNPVTVSEDEIRTAVSCFVGEYYQIPPMYSALKVNGKKLYELARAGKEVERAARAVRIDEIEILRISPPVVTMRVVCSKGTYIRTLCYDIGEKLACGGTMKSLNRTRVGSFLLKDAITLAEIEELCHEERLREVIRPVESCFRECPVLHVREEFRKLLDNGNFILPNQTMEDEIHEAGRWVRFNREDDSFAGIYTFDGEREGYKPVKMFL